MPVTLTELHHGKVFELHLRGTLTADDFHHFVPAFERLLEQHGKISVLLDMQDFHGWDTSGLWQEIKFDVKHFAHIDRLAMIGDRQWERWLAQFCRPFTTATVRYFEQKDADLARVWIDQTV